LIGDKKCDGRQYNTAECGYDGGDCTDFNVNFPNCNVTYPYFIGDGKCDGGEYNVGDCEYDGGDCTSFNTKYPNCDVPFPYNIGNKQCDGDDYNVEECGFDGGDCLIESQTSESFGIQVPTTIFAAIISATLLIA
jgi:hypothetical protein